jgi:polysaccharide export outer membrane protein
MLSNFKVSFFYPFCLLVVLCVSSGFPVLAAELAPETSKNTDYIIGIDDQVMVSVWRNPDLSITVPVRPDGKISTPLVGDIQAAGRTPGQLAGMIEGKLQYYIKDPQVTIILTGLSSHEYLSRVRITGAVREPQSLPFRKGMTILDLVLAAGGITEFAAPSRAVLYHADPITGKTQTYKVNLKNILSKGDLDQNLVLREGDVLTVPESLF